MKAKMSRATNQTESNLKTMNAAETHYSALLCKYFVFYGIRFQLDFSWPVRLVSILCSCTFNLFKANRLLALYLCLTKTNYAIRIVQLLQLSLDIWLYFYLLFCQDSIAEHLENSIGNLPKQMRPLFKQRQKLFRIIYLAFVVEILRLAMLWWLAGTDALYRLEFPFVSQNFIEDQIGYRHLLCNFAVCIALFNKLMNTMLIWLSVFLYFYAYYAEHLQCMVLSAHSDLLSNMVEFKTTYRFFQRQSRNANSVLGTMPFIWFVF